VRLARESDRPLAHVARDLGVHPEALRNWVRQNEADRGDRAEQLSTVERDELKRLRAENTELRRANEILKAASAIFAAGLDRPDEGWLRVTTGIAVRELVLNEASGVTEGQIGVRNGPPTLLRRRFPKLNVRHDEIEGPAVHRCHRCRCPRYVPRGVAVITRIGRLAGV
jgi:transposase